MFNKMPFVLIAMILAVVILNPIMPLSLKESIYAISLSIKSIITFLLPIIIFGLLFKAAVNLAESATKVILLIIIGVCCSNFTSTFLSHYVGSWIYNFDISLTLPQTDDGLKPSWSFELPKLIANNIAMTLGLGLGIILPIINRGIIDSISKKLDKIIDTTLGFFIYLIPFFVMGFVVKLEADNIMGVILKNYTIIFLIVGLAQFTYLGILYLITSNFSIKMAIINIKNMFPAAVVGFSAMSSATAMPLTIIGVNNSTNNKNLAKSIIPATVNIHLIGDCFAIPIFAYAILKNYQISEPDLVSYLIFSAYFVLAKFSVAAIPGGGIIVMLPILEQYLGFNHEMGLLITALYILFDPVITSVNILGNGVFTKMIDNIYGKRMLKTAF